MSTEELPHVKKYVRLGNSGLKVRYVLPSCVRRVGLAWPRADSGAFRAQPNHLGMHVVRRQELGKPADLLSPAEGARARQRSAASRMALDADAVCRVAQGEWVLEEEEALPHFETAYKCGINTWDTVRPSATLFCVQLLFPAWSLTRASRVSRHRPTRTRTGSRR